jgi:hypothetical protein
MQLRSPAFTNDEAIPRDHTADGRDASPPLKWSDVPEATREFVLICDDPDAPREQPWVHWVAFKINAVTRELPAGIPRDEMIHSPVAMHQGRNSFPDENIGYRGPAPPPGHGTHHYHFKLYALDTELNLFGQVDKDTVLNATQGHVLAEAELVGTYER